MYKNILEPNRMSFGKNNLTVYGRKFVLFLELNLINAVFDFFGLLKIIF